jgi:hypothetical protein
MKIKRQFAMQPKDKKCFLQLATCQLPAGALLEDGLPRPRRRKLLLPMAGRHRSRFTAFTSIKQREFRFKAANATHAFISACKSQPIPMVKRCFY